MGCVVFGRFCDHGGTHITLWMDSEMKPGSAKSIKNFVGRKGEFKPLGVKFLRIGNDVILIAKGNEISEHCLFVILFMQEAASLLQQPKM